MSGIPAPSRQAQPFQPGADVRTLHSLLEKKPPRGKKLEAFPRFNEQKPRRKLGALPQRAEVPWQHVPSKLSLLTMSSGQGGANSHTNSGKALIIGLILPTCPACPQTNFAMASVKAAPPSAMASVKAAQPSLKMYESRPRLRHACEIGDDAGFQLATKEQ